MSWLQTQDVKVVKGHGWGEGRIGRTHHSAGQQPLGKVLLVVLLKDVLLLEEAEEHHDLVQHRLDIILVHALQPLPQLVIHEQGDELGRPLVQVDEVLKG